MKKLLFGIVILSAGLLSACKKDKKAPAGSSTTVTPPGTTLDLIKDSVYLYANEDYLWHASLPSYSSFKPRSFTASSDFDALTNELDALSQYAINPATNLPYENRPGNPGIAKYSFMDDGSVAAALNGVKGDFGFGVLYNQVNDLRVNYVYPGSPAALAGIKRGYQITSINGSTNISYDAKGYGTGTSTNLNFVINAYSNSSTISMTLKKPDGTTLTVTNMNTASYTVNPVLKDTVYTLTNGHKLGYLVFNSFTSAANADPKLNAAIDYFVAQGVTDLAVDLRYNGGGYVSTAEYLDNLIVPSAKSNSLMYNTFYTDNMVNGTDPLLKKQWRRDPSSGQDYNYGQFDYSVAANAVNFSKQRSLNVSRVFFIVTGSTASASELTINNLRPVMDVQLVGTQSYGKPVGFFDLNINKYSMYTPEFSTKNSANQGDYYSGFLPGTDIPGVKDYDDPTKDFGDPAEGLLAHILKYVQTGAYAVESPATQGVPLNRAHSLSLQASNQMAIQMDQHAFKGMVFNKKLKLKK